MPDRQELLCANSEVMARNTKPANLDTGKRVTLMYYFNSHAGLLRKKLAVS